MKDLTLQEVKQNGTKLADLYNKANGNIKAFADLLRQTESILDKVGTLNSAIHEHQASLVRIFAIPGELRRLAKVHGMSKQQAEELTAPTIDKEKFDALRNFEKELAALETSVPVEQVKVNALVEQALTEDTLIDAKAGENKHDTAIDGIRARQKQTLIRVGEISQAITANSSAVSQTEDLIRAFTLFDQINEKIVSCKNQLDREARAFVWGDNNEDILSRAREINETLGQRVGQLRIDIRAEQTELKKIGETRGLAKQLDHQIESQMEAIAESKTQIQQDRDQLLLCHGMVTAICNFPYWQSVAKGPDVKMTFIDGQVTYRVPQQVGQLAMMVLDAKYKNWEREPAKARLLVNDLQVAAGKKHLLPHPSVKPLCDYLANPENSKTEGSVAAIALKHTTLGNLAQNSKFTAPRTGMNTVRLVTMEQKKSFLQKYPRLKSFLVGAVIALIVAAIAAIVIGAIIATGGALAIPAAVGAAFAVSAATGTLGGVAHNRIVHRREMRKRRLELVSVASEHSDNVVDLRPFIAKRRTSTALTFSATGTKKFAEIESSEHDMRTSDEFEFDTIVTDASARAEDKSYRSPSLRRSTEEL